MVLQELGRTDGLTFRDRVVALAFPELGARPGSGEARINAWQGRRDRAEAAVSRALLSLERKGLARRERNERGGRTLIRAAAVTELPDWEQLARAEEDMAAHCRKLAGRWEVLAARAQRRADLLREQRSESGTEDEREADLVAVDELESGDRRR
ncbi:MAG: hypothetical protein NVS9B1_26670 [Candidatus Dormibacteraceae bacterium]